MSLDQQGFFWLSNPWVAAFAVVTAVGVLLWCHLSLRADGSGGAVTVPVQARTVSRANGTSNRRETCQQRDRRDAHHRRVA